MILLQSLGILACAGQVTPVTTVTAELGRQLSTSIEVATPLKNDLVFVQPHGADPKTVLNGLAVALHASVRKTGTGLILERSHQDLKEADAARTAARAQWIRQSLDNAAKYRRGFMAKGDRGAGFLDALDVLMKDYEEYSKGQRLGDDPLKPNHVLPMEELLEGLVSKIGIEELASLPSGQNQTYEDQPVYGARPLPEHEQLVTFYEDEMKAVGKISIPAEKQSWYEMYSLNQYTKGLGIQVPLAKLRLRVRPESASFDFTLEGFDSNGAKIDTAWLNVRPLGYWVAGNLVMKAEALKPDSHWVKLSEESAAVAKFCTGEPDPSAPLPDWYVHPDKIEPLNLMVKEALTGVAEETPQQPVVIEVADNLWWQAAECCRGNRLNLDAFVQLVGSWTDYEQLDRDGTVIWRPNDMEWYEGSQASRKALSRFARAFASSRQEDLKSICGLVHDASAQNSSLVTEWLNIDIRMTGPLHIQSSCGDNLFRLMGAISDQNWDALVTSRSTTCGNAGVVSDVSSFLNDAYGLKTEGGSVPDLYTYPTEVLTEGVVDSTPLILDASTVQMVRDIPGGPWSAVYSPASLFQIPPYSVQWDGDTPRLTITREQFEDNFKEDEFQFGTRLDLTIKIGLNGKLFTAGTVTGGVEPSGEFVSYPDLPQATKDAIWKYACTTALTPAHSVTLSYGGSVSTRSSPAKPPPKP